MPAPGSPEEQAAFAFVDHLLNATAGQLSALVVINEPSIDTLAPDLAPGADGRIPVVFFLRQVTEHIDAEHRTAAGGGRLPLFGGGMTRLDIPKVQNSAATRAMIRWIDSDPRVTGADFHLHQPGMPTTERALQFIHHAIPNKPLMVTEMSLIWKWQEHLGDRIDASATGRAFSGAYSRSARAADRCLGH